MYKDINNEARAAELRKTDNYHRLYNCFQDSMYSTIITNLPYMFMEFKGLGMRDVVDDLPLFVNIGHYKAYLDAYAKMFNIREHIQFNTLIKSVRLYDNLTEEEKTGIETPRKFVVKTADAHGSSLEANEKTHTFDYVIVTGGQYSDPYIPSIPGAEEFQGKQIHYKNFGSPNLDLYTDKRVLIFGGSDSAHDMIIQLLSEDVKRVQDCKKVVFCSRKVQNIQNSTDFEHIIKEGRLSLHEGTVVSFRGPNTVCFSDGTEEEVDTVIYSTGYKLRFPYFDKRDGLIDHDENQHRGVFFGPLYKKFVSIRHPDLFFLGYLETTLIVNILPELQAMVVKYILEGKLNLPSQDEMMADYNEEVDAHMKHIGNLQYFYKSDISERFPALTGHYEHDEWMFFTNLLKTVHPNNNDKKGDEYFNLIAETKKVLKKFKTEGNLLQYKKYDYHQVYPEEFRNTSDFV